MSTNEKEPLEPSEMKSVLKKISTLYKQGEFTPCIQECNKAIKQGYKNAGIWNTKAIALMQLGEYEKAEQNIDIALQLAPENENYTKNKRIIAAKREEKEQKEHTQKKKESTVPHTNPQQEEKANPQPSLKNQEKHTPTSNTFIIESKLDPAEEIRRYQSLLDNGIIDQHYFEMKKQELQNAMRK